MKTPVLCTLIAAAAAGSGISVGWLLFAAPATTEQANPARRIIPPSAGNPKASPGPGDAGVSPPEQKPLIARINPDGLNTMLAAMAKLDPQTYAETMLAMDHSPDTAERYLHTIARDMGANGAQAAAYLRLFRERQGIGAEDNTQNLRTFMTLVGGRDGLKAIRSFLEVYPDGFNGLDSLVHGVALQHPQEAVDW